ncbi:hypothetical protein LX36DRAFT_702467 [Colletotrichum falcatum]|nr:hypothetical protein LX36DRAFT_702467 [Colletotrichum falcatum]
MKFSTAAFIALGFFAGNVISAPTVQTNNVAPSIEARTEGFAANAAAVEARAEKRTVSKANIAAREPQNKNGKNNKNKNNNNNNNNKANANAADLAKFNGLACTNGKGAGTCDTKGTCTVNGKSAQVAGQCGIAAAAAANAGAKAGGNAGGKKKNGRREIVDVADLI